MITIRKEYCPACKRELIRGDAGSTKIASPLVTCSYCGKTSRTHLNAEWCHTERKVLRFGPGYFMALGGFLVSLENKGVLGALLMALCAFLIYMGIFHIPTLIRIIASNARMRKPEYLKQLLDYGVITKFEYDMRTTGHHEI